jgi:hypothetical protein
VRSRRPIKLAAATSQEEKVAERSGQPTAQEWIAGFADKLPADSGGVPAAEEQSLILALSRIAAHASERIAAPIASYMVGVALASRDTDSRVIEIRRLVEELEVNAGQQ